MSLIVEPAAGVPPAEVDRYRAQLRGEEYVDLVALASDMAVLAAAGVDARSALSGQLLVLVRAEMRTRPEEVAQAARRAAWVAAARADALEYRPRRVRVSHRYVQPGTPRWWFQDQERSGASGAGAGQRMWTSPPTTWEEARDIWTSWLTRGWPRRMYETGPGGGPAGFRLVLEEVR